MSFKFELENKVEDRVTGFKGIITARAEYTGDTHTYLVVPRIEKPSEQPEGEWICEEKLDRVS